MAVEVVKGMEIDECEGGASTSMVDSGKESQLIQTGHGFDDHDCGVVKYPSQGTAIEEQVLAFEKGFDMERAMESEFAV